MALAQLERPRCVHKRCVAPLALVVLAPCVALLQRLFDRTAVPRTREARSSSCAGQEPRGARGRSSTRGRAQHAAHGGQGHAATAHLLALKPMFGRASFCASPAPSPAAAAPASSQLACAGPPSASPPRAEPCAGPTTGDDISRGNTCAGAARCRQDASHT
jgi:hypothetical protein